MTFEGAPLPIDAKHAPGLYFTRLVIAPTKGAKRCVEKVESEYGGVGDVTISFVDSC